MNINNVTNTAFNGNLHFLTMPMKFSANNSDVGNVSCVGYDRNEFNNEIKDMKHIMHVPNDESQFYDLELNADNIKFLSPSDIRYSIPNTNYEVTFLFNDGKPLKTQDYNKILAAYTAAKTGDSDFTVNV